MYSWDYYKNLPNNKNLSLETLWIRYNDMIYYDNPHPTVNQGGKLNSTKNDFVEDDYVEDYFEN